MLRRRISFLCCTALAAALLAGCGGEFDRASAGSGEASGSAVSGAAVSGTAVSGSAVDELPVSSPGVKRPAQRVNGKKDRENWFYSETNFYYARTCEQNESDGTTYIVERNLADGTERQILCNDLSNLCYVDDNWVYYTVDGEYFDGHSFPSTHLYRAPIEKNRLNLDKAKQILTEYAGIEPETLYCDGRYVIYITIDYLDCQDSIYKIYDLKKQDYTENFVNSQDGCDPLLAVAGGRIYFRLDDRGFYCHELKSGKQTKISGREVYGSTFAVAESDVFYSEDAAIPLSVKKYHWKDGSKQKVITEKQIEELVVENHLAKGKDFGFQIDGMFISGNRLYVQFELDWNNGGVGSECKKEVVAYIDIKDDQELHYAKELTECLTGDNIIYEESGDKFYSRGKCIDMTDETCYMLVYNETSKKITLARYDFAQEQFSYVEREDLDWHLPYFAASFVAMEKTFEEMPDRESDWTYTYYYDIE